MSDKVDTWLQTALARVTAALWPAHCVLCGGLASRSNVDLCQGCEADLPVILRGCAICAEPLAVSHAEAVRCGACLRRRQRFDGSFIPFRYGYPLDHMVRRLKYGGSISMGRVLGELFVRRLALRPSEPLPQLLLPVPLAHRRFCTRGYNQAIVLAEHISREAGLPLRTDVLVRTRDTLEQAGLDQRARRRNIRKAFEVDTTVAATHVAIVDDVVTTGSTASEIARILKRAGVKRVDVWAIARAARSLTVDR